MNRLTSATKGLDKIEFTYDEGNRCVERAYYHQGALAQKTGLVYDGWNLVQEIDLVNGNTVQATYVHGAGTDELLCRSDAQGTIYYHQDGLGSTTSLTGETGQVLERYTYDLFGKVTVLALTGLILPVSAFRNRFLFTGREYLAEAGLYDYRNRVYSSELGRFLQIDPLLFQAGDVNIYRYCHNNGVNWRDPEGLCDTPDPSGTRVAEVLMIQIRFDWDHSHYPVNGPHWHYQEFHSSPNGSGWGPWQLGGPIPYIG